MARHDGRNGNGRNGKARNGNGHGKRRGRLFRAFERLILSFGMSLVAFVIERRLIKAIKKGGVEPAPRTAAGHEPVEQPGGPLLEAHDTERHEAGTPPPPAAQGPDS